jgi:hypothetical protein
MRMAWGKADKAPGRKREQKQRLARQQKRKDFAKNMERAAEMAQKWYSEPPSLTYNLSILPTLDVKFVDWAINRYRYLQSAVVNPMTKKHKAMHEQWNEIVATAEACKKATDARTYPKRRAQHKRTVAKFRADRTQSRIEAAQSIAAEMQAKKQERAVAAVAFLEDVITERVGAAMQAKMQERALR